MDPVCSQDTDFVFESAIKGSIEDEWRHGSRDLGPTDSLPLEVWDQEYEAFFGLSPLSSPSDSPSSSRPCSPHPFDLQPPLAPSSPIAPSADATIATHRAPPSAIAPIADATSTAHKATSSAAAPTRKAQNSKRRRNRGKCHEKRRKKRRKERDDLEGAPYVVSDRVVEKLVGRTEPTRASYDADSFPTASSGYIALPDEGGRVYGLKELVEVLGFRVEKWDGSAPRPIVDASSRIIGVLAGHPDDPTWEGAHLGALKEILASRGKCSFPPKAMHHRRGKFPALSWGISHGGGQKRPGNLYHAPQNARVLSELTASEHVYRIAGYASKAFSLWAPKLYTYYETHLEKLLNHDPALRRNFPNSIWASFAVNFGPQTVCSRHRDFANLPYGWCGITALGDFDPTQGGHLVLWDLKIAVEFPPGSTILIPSAAVAHSNVPVRKGETRCSFTQYTAGGLFRWVEQGFQRTTDYMSALTPKEVQEDLRRQEARCKLGLSLFSTVASIPVDQANRKRRT